MLLWRIGASALPTKVNLSRRFDHIDSTCILCNNAEESPIHLFFGCPFTRAFWASACWGLRIETSSLVTDEDIIKLILIPPNSPFPSHDQWTISLNMALIIDEIWGTRNLIQFQEGIADIHLSKKNVQTRFLEYSRVFSVSSALPAVQPTPVWTPPPHGWIKLNVDAVLNSSKSALAVVARDHQGEVLYIWGCQHHLCSPSQAEASSILWAVKLALQEHWKSIIDEGNAQVCFDALSSQDHILDWNICTIINNIRSLSSSFVSCKFRWIKRNSNSAVHSAARIALNSCQQYCFNKSNIPPPLKSVCMEDSSLCSFVCV
ncbi:uncharacterized protein LOC142612404 [Castanea sativa]|uniref:uncharacterized protein LOC142612404 n=1 Tax=Castanea sativa TaxID=21020 RepID=UPI003F64F30A